MAPAGWQPSVGHPGDEALKTGRARLILASMGHASLSDAQRDPAGLLERVLAGEAVTVLRDGVPVLEPRAPAGAACPDAASSALPLRTVPSRAPQPDAASLIRELRGEERM
jgi:antitoxin (DNA-binding transcriptional repressor) of toxin-antitoxin stability system